MAARERPSTNQAERCSSMNSNIGTPASIGTKGESRTTPTTSSTAKRRRATGSRVDGGARGRMGRHHNHYPRREVQGRIAERKPQRTKDNMELGGKRKLLWGKGYGGGGTIGSRMYQAKSDPKNDNIFLGTRFGFNFFCVCSRTVHPTILVSTFLGVRFGILFSLP